MKVLDICILDDLKEINIESYNIDVFVQIDDGYTYKLSFATPKYLEFYMDKEKMDYYEPGPPFIIVNKLTPEIIEQAIKAFAKEAGGYWLKVYHFAGWSGAIDESIFDQLKAKQIEEQESYE
jgi:hypothetical protein